MDRTEEIPAEYEESIARMEREIAAAIAPHLPYFDDVCRSMAAMTEPIMSAVAAMQPILGSITLPEYFEPMAFVPYRNPKEEPRTMRLASDQFDALSKQVTAQVTPQQTLNELMYDWNEQELFRFALGQKITSAFAGKDSNKRRQFVEKLLRTRGYVSTKTLRNILNLSEKQLGNMVAAINSKIGFELTLKEPLVISKRGKGYRINPAYTVYKKK
jgi:hypothetical protein